MAKYDKDKLIADFHTGMYSQRELANKHDISLGTVNRLTKGLEKKTERLVNSKIEVIQASRDLTVTELNAVEHAVSFKMEMLRDIESFSSKAMRKASDLIDNSESGSDFKAVVEGVDRISILTKINNRHAPPSTNIQASQTNLADVLSELAGKLPS